MINNCRRCNVMQVQSKAIVVRCTVCYKFIINSFWQEVQHFHIFFYYNSCLEILKSTDLCLSLLDDDVSWTSSLFLAQGSYLGHQMTDHILYPIMPGFSV